jgi:4-alpha-glucanotransferase
MEQPIRFAFGIHLHQPVGNFDSVFEQHLDEVYRPFLQAVAEREFLPISVHISGPLLEWLEQNAAEYLDLVGRLAADGKVELLLAGFYEPVLAVLPREDRIEQIRWMRGALANRFGVDARGLWLTERVWEPDLAADLHDAGVRYALVDDRHFLVTGFKRDQLHAPYWTESGGKRVALFPIDEKLRYLIPFQPPQETATYLRILRENGHRLAVLADDGEKFGGWPGTKEWVYDRGWLTQFLSAMEELVDSGEMVLSTFAEALDEVPSGGLAYLSTASYREMEAWSLPTEQSLRLTRLERDLGDRLAGPDGTLVRGSHWRNFLVKYPESNRMHKKMVALSELSRRQGDPAVARRAVGRAQCNDAYWHGVFGGLYLPHLRDAIWHQLAIAERTLRHGQPIAFQVLDIDCDGHQEVWVHSAVFSAIVSPYRGGAIEEYTSFAAGLNYANTLTRRREAYHQLSLGHDVKAQASPSGDAAPSIHDLEHAMRLDELPPIDLDTRALFVDRVLRPEQSSEKYARGEYHPLRSWAATALAFHVERTADAVDVVMHDAGDGEATAATFGKRIRFSSDGSFSVTYRWDPAQLPEGTFATEISHARPLVITPAPAAEVWTHDIDTVAKSERGLDRTRQGQATTLGWPVSLGAASARVAWR